MNLPSINSRDLVPHLKKLAALIDQGWMPCLNIVDTEWHVALTHKSCDVLAVMMGGDWEDQFGDDNVDNPLDIHEFCRSLHVALDRAIKRAQATVIQ